MANRHTIEDLQYLQALPLDLKIRLTKQRIREWIREYGEDGVYVAFSGGKDSTVLLDLVREEYPNVKAMFVDVPTQYPELKAFVKTFDNVDIVKPKMSFKEVCEKYGFPLISKEVSECVYGARKYLRSVIENGGGGTSTDSTNSAEEESLRMGVRETDREWKILQALEAIASRGGVWKDRDNARYFAKLTDTLTKSGGFDKKRHKGDRQRGHATDYWTVSKEREDK